MSEKHLFLFLPDRKLLLAVVASEFVQGQNDLLSVAAKGDGV